MTETSFAAHTDTGPIAGHVSGAGTALLLLHGGPAITDYSWPSRTPIASPAC
jgi:hypothetical protein